ncbi:hypothetical protein niasHT_001249 [Heterodera trifolii]|uniref:Uncharacterized protein n=1 Tax=Heterodera trifolii TaxID=157864 RepID=A0ABD2M6E9_9BILA
MEPAERHSPCPRQAEREAREWGRVGQGTESRRTEQGETVCVFIAPTALAVRCPIFCGWRGFFHSDQHQQQHTFFPRGAVFVASLEGSPTPSLGGGGHIHSVGRHSLLTLHDSKSTNSAPSRPPKNYISLKTNEPRQRGKAKSANYRPKMEPRV